MGIGPLLYKRTVAEIIEAIEEQLSTLHWQGRTDGAGRAMAQLYGRLAEVMTNRLNQSPEQHFRAFLNEAGIDRLVARAARTDITFFPAEDGPAVIQAPQGTQITAPPTETRPEIVFETERALNVAPTRLERCIVVDQLNYSDHTAQARGEIAEPFAAFSGEIERERVLYIAHDKLLSFTDEASRENAQVVLEFEFAPAGAPARDGKWQIEWRYWDGEGWLLLQPPATDIQDNTEHFSKDGAVVFINLPLLQKCVIHERESYWLAAKLTGGAARNHLPTVKDVRISRKIVIPPPEVQEGAAQLPLPNGILTYQHSDRKEQRYFLGHADLFTFADAIQRHRATYTLTFTFEKAGSPPVGDSLQLEWLYWSENRWRLLAESGTLIDDRTERLSKAGVVTFSGLPKLAPSELNGLTSTWLAFRLTSTDARTVTPIIRSVQIRREIPAEPAPINAALSAIQAGSIFVPLDPKGPFMPLGAAPLDLDSFYLRIDEAFTKAGAKVTIHFTLQGLPAELEDTSNLDQLTIEWEYFSEDGWVALGACVRGCPTLEAYNFDAEPAFGKPTVASIPFSRRKVLEFAIPDHVDLQNLPAPFRTGKVITDIYTGAHFVQIPIPPGCVNLPEEILVNGCYKAARLNFRDKTCAFTASGDAVVELVAPKLDSADPQFAPTEVGGEAGYWIRARVVAGSYDVPQKGQRSLLTGGILGQAPYLPPITYPPVIAALYAEYSNYYHESVATHPSHCVSRTDARWLDHCAALRMAQPFTPYSAKVAVTDGGSEEVDYEIPALYLGFHPLLAESELPAFPPGYWIQLRMDLEEAENVPISQLRWEYWNGKRWRTLRADDKTRGLTRSEYFGFVAPDDHVASDEFGHRGYWFRIRREATKATTTEQSQESSRLPPFMPWLKRIDLNTVPVVNSETITEELLGSSSGAPYQLFTLTRTPVLADVEIEVREPDQRTESETAQLGNNVATVQNPAVAQTTTAPSGNTHEGWVLWKPVAGFHMCGPTDRCYLVDQESGQIRFGDGRRGRIPPPGIDNIRARRYRTHAGEQGNLPPNTITELRNPSGGLNDIQLVTNPAATSGGFAVESISRAQERGPNTLKNRQRAVTVEDYHWLALEIDGVERAHTIPTYDGAGETHAGSVTVIVIPKPTDALPENVKRKLVPTPALLRMVEKHLADHILTNLRDDEQSTATDVDQIYVVGPKYVAAKVTAIVVPTAPEQADSVRIAVLERLDEFLHPVHGGPQRVGWQPGRAVYLSEIAAEIEHVLGVDHVAYVTLAGEALLQQELTVTALAELADEMPAGSQVSTFDEQTKMILTNPLPAGALQRVNNGQGGPAIIVHGFKRDDRVQVVTTHHDTLFGQLQVDQVSRFVDDEDDSAAAQRRNLFALTFRKPVAAPKVKTPSGTLLSSHDRRVRLAIIASHIRFDAAHQVHFTGVTVAAFARQESVCLIHPHYPYRRKDFLAVNADVAHDQPATAARIFVPSDHLVYSGDHTITISIGKT